MEATGHYHRALVSYLDRSGYTYYMVNPLDAWHLAEMYYRGDVKPHRTWNETFTELQHLTRQHEFVTGIFVQAKLNSRALLEQVFPTYEQVFYNVFSAKGNVRLIEDKRRQPFTRSAAFVQLMGRMVTDAFSTAAPL
nr:IS110 family transposase [Paenibacillus lautus]